MKKNIISLSIVALLFITSTSSAYSFSPSQTLKNVKNAIVQCIPTQATFTSVYKNHPLAVKATVIAAAVTTAAIISYKYCPYVRSTMLSVVNTVMGKKQCPVTRPCSACKPKPNSQKPSCSSGSCSVKEAAEVYEQEVDLTTTVTNN